MEIVRKLVLTLPTGAEQHYILSKPTITLGRATTNDVSLADPKASRFHARIECDDDGCTIVDLGSANGTRVNGQRVESSPLATGDTIQVGASTVRFEEHRPVEETSETIIGIPDVEDWTPEELDTAIGSETIVQTLADTSHPRLAIHLSPRTWEVTLVEDAMTIGREPSADIVIADPQVSRAHARLERRADGYWIVDLGSRNGTRVKGHRIAEQLLETGTEIRIGPALLVFKAGFGARDMTVVGVAPEVVRPTRIKRIPVVIIPGFMGSEMHDESGRLIWPNMHRALANPDIYRWPDKKLTVGHILRDHVIIPNFIQLARYSRLVDYLQEELGYLREEDLLEFPYDWRQDYRISAEQLGEKVMAWRSAKGHDEIAIIGHSQGCLITRYYVERLGGKGHVGRIVLMGGPHAGSPRTFQAFLSAHGILAFNSIRSKFQRVVTSFPSVYQTLPIDGSVVDEKGEVLDIFTDDSWVPEERRPMLHAASAFYRELGTTTSVQTLCVFGYGLKTPIRLVVEGASLGLDAWKSARLEVEDVGDDTIPQDSAVLEGAEIHPVQQHHGVLYTDADVRMRLRLELVGK